MIHTTRKVMLSLCLCLALGACATDQGTGYAGPVGEGISLPEEMWCADKGYRQYSPAFKRCVETRPDLAVASRKERLDDLDIIKRNRSASRMMAQSYPVY